MNEVDGLGYWPRNNPQEHDYVEPQEHTLTMADGRELTKAEFIEWLSKNLKWVSAREYEHYDDLLTIEIPLDNS